MAGDNLKLMGKIENFYQDLIPILQKFPKAQRYTLAENIEKETLACVRLAFEARYIKDGQIGSLKKLRTNLHVITFLLRISRKSSFINDAIYEKLTRETSEMGKITSGWIKNEEARIKAPQTDTQKAAARKPAPAEVPSQAAQV